MSDSSFPPNSPGTKLNNPKAMAARKALATTPAPKKAAAKKALRAQRRGK